MSDTKPERFSILEQVSRSIYVKARHRFGKRDRHVRLLQNFGIDVVFDVGGNTGQYAETLIKRGFGGRIVSFEPQPDAFEKLRWNARRHRQWQVENYALGSEEGTATFNIAGNSQSSSFQPMLDRHVESAPDSAYVGQVDVRVDRMDQIFDQFCSPGERVFAKLDVQGHEHQVLEGAAGCLDKITGLELELSIVPLYAGQRLWRDMIDSAAALGFDLARITPGFSDPRSGVMLQADGVFMRSEAVNAIRAAA